MEEIGKILRQTRQEQNKSLADISKETRIQEKLLIALEEGDVSAFAGEVYFRGALRNYAEAIGLDYQELRKMYDEKQSSPKEGSPAKVEKKEKTISKPIFEKKRPVISFNALVWLILFVVVIGGGIWYLLQRDGASPEVPEAPEAEIETPGESPDDVMHEEDEEPEIDVNDTEVEISLTNETGQQSEFSVSGADQLDLAVTFNARCWIRLSVDDVVIEEKNYSPGEGLTAQAGNSIEILLGYPMGAEITLNELYVPVLEDKVNPHTVRFTIE